MCAVSFFLFSYFNEQKQRFWNKQTIGFDYLPNRCKALYFQDNDKISKQVLHDKPSYDDPVYK